MDAKLVAWGRAVKSGRGGSALPPLWLFTDRARLGDPRRAVAGLPKGLCGVVFRHDGEAGRAGLAAAVARICRARRLALVIAGDARLAAALGAGLHLRGGKGRGGLRLRGPVTSSAHSLIELARARRAGAALAFLSPAFATASHPGAKGLGASRWSALARQAGLPVAALGGIDGRSVRGLRWARAVGAIGALAPGGVC